MTDNRTGLSAADIAESFRDRCGDGSVEWVYTPMQTWVLLDAADMLEENEWLVMKLNAEHIVRQNLERENVKLREQLADMPKCKECETMFKCEDCEAMLDCDECLRADASQKERKRLDYENAKLRELVRDVYTLHWNGLDCTECPWFDECDTTGGCPWLGIFADHMRELGVDE